MDESKYKEGENITSFSEWIINNLTNIDISSLTPFQETTIEGIFTLGVMVIITQLICVIK